MNLLFKYFATEIARSVAFVMAALLALFSFFDMMRELQMVNTGQYQIQHAALYVLLGLPGWFYEFMPIAVLIGTIYVLAQFASKSEFTIMRAAGMSTFMAGKILFKVGLIFVALTFLFGEFIAPISSKFAEKMKLSALETGVSQSFKSGLWTKDLIRENGLVGNIIGTRFINVKEILPNRILSELTVYEFDTEFHLQREWKAKEAIYLGANTWRLTKASEVSYPKALDAASIANIKRIDYEKIDVVSEITPDILAVLFADPDRMSALDLAAYAKHLADNKQDSERYEIAFWKKVTYPFAVFVMMALALPFAYMQARSGGVSFKIFSGIMIGIVFYLLNALFSHLGLLNTWPAPVTAIIPSLAFLGIAAISLYYVERR